MPLLNPLPEHCIAIILLLPAIYYAGLNLAKKASTDPSIQLLLAPGISLASWLITTQLLAQITTSFSTGLWLASITIALTGVYFYYINKNDASQLGLKTNPTSKLYSSSMWLSATATSLMILGVALYGHFHDEYYVTGHLSIISQIQNDTFPPVHMSFPDQALKYHYGFDLFSAIITALFRVSVDLAIDIATTILWFYTWCLLWIVGERSISKERGFLLPLIMLFGGGLLFLGDASYQNDPMLSRLLGLTSVNGNQLNPPFISYFFQHPWALGITFTTCIFLLTLGNNIQQNKWRYAILILLFIALSFSHVVLFLTIFGSFLAAEYFREKSIPVNSALTILLLLILTLSGVIAVGGFFQLSSNNFMESITFRSGAFNDFTTYSEWFIYNFGLLLPMGIAGVFYLKSDRIFFTSLLLGNLFVFNFMDYKLTYDIAKFAAVLSLALAFLSCVTVAHFLDNKKTFITRALGVSSILILVNIGISFTLVAGLNPKNPILTLNDKALIRLSEPDTLAVNWLRKHIKQKDIVLRKRPISTGYAQWGGIPQLWLTNEALTFGFDKNNLDKRIKLQSTLPSDSESYYNSGVRWLVLSQEDTHINNYVNHWLVNKNIVLRAEFPPLKIFEFINKEPGST